MTWARAHVIGFSPTWWELPRPPLPPDRDNKVTIARELPTYVGRRRNFDAFKAKGPGFVLLARDRNLSQPWWCGSLYYTWHGEEGLFSSPWNGPRPRGSGRRCCGRRGRRRRWRCRHVLNEPSRGTTCVQKKCCCDHQPTAEWTRPKQSSPMVRVALWNNHYANMPNWPQQRRRFADSSASAAGIARLRLSLFLFCANNRCHSFGIDVPEYVQKFSWSPKRCWMLAAVAGTGITSCATKGPSLARSLAHPTTNRSYVRR